MSYTPTNWQRGDKITSEKLNKIENGIAGAGGGVLLAVGDRQTATVDKTWQEIVNSVLCVMRLPKATGVGFDQYLITKAYFDETTKYTIEGIGLAWGSNTGMTVKLAASSADGYPVLQFDD